MSDEFPITFDCGPDSNFTVYEASYQNLLNSYYCGENFGDHEFDKEVSKSIRKSSNYTDDFPAVLDCGSGYFAIYKNASSVEDYSDAYDCGKDVRVASHSAAPAMLRRQGKTTLVAYVFAILMLSGCVSA
ncbi:unnamed protein product [Kuraishia capsulata CBS 1993]|uniref:Uncharacterized protein n=1 Tax=Kuraishia capsulata CBS 1993 TaxID=1382522 RepID=W6MWV5_9ASCO|nr:uncharacterized protein KUCA_T00003905001 [Kuraishia capsulata CBS 1993]CDK27925.1 unnamed protein product [Kuraishia capsulata CBS 1993]